MALESGGDITVPVDLSGVPDSEIERETQTWAVPSSTVRSVRALSLAALVCVGGCVSNLPPLWNKTTNRKAPDHVQKVLPGYERILIETGWLEFVTSNIDAIEYYDWPAFDSSNGPAVGLAAYEEATRVARLALTGRTEHDIVATLVHEAAHLSGIAQVGRMYGEDIAVAVERQFRRDCQKNGPSSKGKSTKLPDAKRSRKEAL